MARLGEKFKVNPNYLETPFTIRQVETHLIFGPLSRHLSVAYLFLAAGILKLVYDIRDSHITALEKTITIIWDVSLWIVLFPFIALRLTRRQQAIVAWGAVKFALGFAALMVTIGGFGGLAEHHPDALPNLFLGLIWIPGVEFIPQVTPHQKYVTIVRLLLSIPCIYYGVKSGNWHWS